MVPYRFFVYLTTALHLASASKGKTEAPSTSPNIIPGSYIVEFEEGSTTQRISSQSGFKIVKQFDSEVFRGAAIQATTLTEDNLKQLPGVRNVWANSLVELQSFESEDVSIQGSVFADRATGVLKLHEQGIFGQGVKIGLVDTGVDYMRAELGGGFGDGFKIGGGYDLVGDGLWAGGSNLKSPDNDPRDQIGYGTFAAGIIGSDLPPWRGVAPEATIYAYKVFAQSRTTDVATLIEAFLRAYEDGVDIITASTYNWNGWSEHPWSLVASRLVDRGIVVTITAGDDGPVGPFFGSSGSSGDGVISVTSADVLPSIKWIRSSSFSSWGLLNDLKMKPDIAAPGASIEGLWINNGRRTHSGAAMATPYVAGVAALYISAKGGRDVHGPQFARDLGRRIVASGAAVRYDGLAYDDPTIPASVAQVGNGLIDAYQVVFAETDLNFEPIALNDTAHFNPYHEITITNNGANTVDYTFSVEHAAGFNTLSVNPVDGSQRVHTALELQPIELNTRATLPVALTLPPGQQQTINVSFENPESFGWNAARLPLYSGKIVIAGSNGDVLSVPFVGVAGDIKNDLDSVFMERYVVFGQPPQRITTPNLSFTFNLSLGTQDFPKFARQLLWGTRQLRYDIFYEDWNEELWSWPLVPGQDSYVGSATYWEGSGYASTFNPELEDPGDTIPYPRLNLQRNTYIRTEDWWFGKLADGSQIELGNYKLRYAALRPFGNPENSDDWDASVYSLEVLGKY